MRANILLLTIWPFFTPDYSMITFIGQSLRTRSKRFVWNGPSSDKYHDRSMSTRSSHTLSSHFDTRRLFYVAKPLSKAFCMLKNLIHLVQSSEYATVNLNSTTWHISSYFCPALGSCTSLPHWLTSAWRYYQGTFNFAICCYPLGPLWQTQKDFRRYYLDFSWR